MYLKSIQVTLAVLMLGAILPAHHSVPVNFDQSREVTIKGVLTEIKWINPTPAFGSTSRTRMVRPSNGWSRWARSMR